MAIWDFLRRRPQQTTNVSQHKTDIDVAVAATGDDVSLTYADRQITFKGSLTGYNYREILKSKQKHIVDLYELADYYTDADPLIRGIIRQVYVPFCTVDKYKLVGANERVKQKYLEYYTRIELDKKMISIFDQFFKYANVVIYLMEDGTIITLPIHLCRIGNVEMNGEPIVEFNCKTVRDDLMRQASSVYKEWIDDYELDNRLKGFPPEVATALKKKGTDWVQLNPENTFVMQDVKEDWVRYSIPFISGCLIPLEKKERISNYEDSLIDLAARSFVHVTYGDDKQEVLPTVGVLRAIGATFKSAMTGSALAVTNHHCKAVVIQPKTDDVFSNDKYSMVNNEILSAGGISGIIISGRSEDGSSFASAQVSTQTVAIRVRRAKELFCDIMNKINRRVNISGGGRMKHSSEKQIPKFTFPPVDLNGSKQLQEACKYLFEKGLLSHESLMDSFGIDMEEQYEKKSSEEQRGIHEVLAPSDKDNCLEKDESTNERGRPTLDDDERQSDPSKSITGRQPKASNPDGSDAQTDGNTVTE